MGLLSGVRENWRKTCAQAAVALGAAAIAGSLLFQPEPQAAVQNVRQPSAYADELELRLGEVLSQMTGAGRVEVVIQYAEDAYAGEEWFSAHEEPQRRGTPTAVIVVAEGAGDLHVRLQLARAVETLLQLNAETVEVFEMRKEE